MDHSPASQDALSWAANYVLRPGDKASGQGWGLGAGGRWQGDGGKLWTATHSMARDPGTVARDTLLDSCTGTAGAGLIDGSLIVANSACGVFTLGRHRRHNWPHISTAAGLPQVKLVTVMEPSVKSELAQGQQGPASGQEGGIRMRCRAAVGCAARPLCALRRAGGAGGPGAAHCRRGLPHALHGCQPGTAPNPLRRAAAAAAAQAWTRCAGSLPRKSK